MSVQLFGSENSLSSYYSPQLKKRRMCGESSKSIELFDSENSIGSPQLKRHRVCDESKNSVQLFDSESSISSPQFKNQQINGSNEASQKSIQIDQNRHIVCYPGLIINGKYKILRTLGEGAFGRVVEVQNLHTNMIMALKTIRNVEEYRNAAMHEIKVLEEIWKADPQDTSFCIKMLDWFNFYGHICIVFKVLGLSLHRFLEENNFQPFPLDQVRHIGHQLCQSVNFLHRNGITHTDLKPDNILFVNTNVVQRTDVRLIDFGNAQLDQKLRKTNITTRFYRAPEVILKMGWDCSSDVWSIACILFELYVGDMLFTIPDDSHHHLAVMEKILGQFPEQMAHENKKNYFVEGKVNFDWNNVFAEMKTYYKPLNKYMLSQSKYDIALFDLLKRMLAYEPSKRINLAEVLKHSFFENL